MSLRDFMCMYSHTQESDLTYYFVAGALMNLCDAFKAKAVTDTMRGRFGFRGASPSKGWKKMQKKDSEKKLALCDEASAARWA